MSQIFPWPKYHQTVGTMSNVIRVNVFYKTLLVSFSCFFFLKMKLKNQIKVNSLTIVMSEANIQDSQEDWLFKTLPNFMFWSTVWLIVELKSLQKPINLLKTYQITILPLLILCRKFCQIASSSKKQQRNKYKWDNSVWSINIHFSLHLNNSVYLFF